LKDEFPFCCICTVHVPAAIKDTTFPASEHTEGVSVTNPTVSPDVAVPLMEYVAPPTTGFAGCVVPGVMVCDAPPIEKVCTTRVAAFQLASPAWSACTVHWPDVSSENTPLLTLQTAGVPDVNATVRPDVAVARGVYVLEPAVAEVGAPLVIEMVWLPLPIVYGSVT
jgi:hypothetical protein